MKEKYFNGVNAQQCESIDYFYDLLLRSEDFTHFLSAGLEGLVSRLNCTGGAMYFFNPVNEISPEWITFNVPDVWNTQFADPQSQINQDACSCYVNQTIMGENLSLGISAILPLTYHRKSLGVLVLNGDALTPIEAETAEVLCFTFSRILLSQSHALSIFMEQKGKDLLQTIESSLDFLITNPNLALSNLLYNIRKYLGADYLLFLEIDQDFPEIVSRRLLANQDEWIAQPSQRIVPERMQQLCESTHDPLHTSMIINDFLADLPAIDISAIRSIEIAPVQSKSDRIENDEPQNEPPLAYILLINPKVAIGPQYKNYLAKACLLISNVLLNIHSLEKMKVNLARLEVGQVELRNSRNNLRTLFDNIPMAIYIVDSSYKIIIVNIARAHKLSLEPSQIAGKTCYEALYNRTTPCPACRVRESIKEGISTTRLWREWLTSETFVEWEIRTHPILDEMQRPIQVIVSEMDVTEKRNLEANLIQSEKLAAVGQLAAGVAHEINNPLSAIIANAQILLQEVPKENVDEVESLRLIETAGIRASQVVRNLLSISRKENLEYELIDINNSIRNALVLVQHELLKRPITVKLELEEPLPPVLSQQQHLQGVWINLMLNAIDAIEATGRQDGMITIKTTALQGEIQISIGDNGQGIDPEKVKKVFEPFFTTKSAGQGTGLGLSVCLRVIKEHQGTISVESQSGQGTRFIILLPLNLEKMMN